jgi:probable rRNA maturation factor
VTSAPQTDVVIDLRVADARWESLASAEALARRALGVAGRQAGEAGEVSILLTNDAEMRALNKHWRGIDKATDVLSFPSDGPAIPGEPVHLGDIAIGYETALRDAEAMKRPFDGHFSHLVVHGFLHLAGYDHIAPEDAAVMEPLETKILGLLGWPDPYATGPYANEHRPGERG